MNALFQIKSDDVTSESIPSVWKCITRKPFHPVATERISIRLHELDGLRGWAALSVVLYHIFWETFGIVMPALRNPITGFLLDGPLAVSIFFVLSGEALSSAYFAGKGDLAVVQLALKRYTRLTIPILALATIVFFLVKINAVHNVTAGHLVQRENWLGSWLQFPVNPMYFVRYALLDVYRLDFSPAAVDPFLWTMKYEMQGSFLVFAIILSFRYLKLPWLIILISALILLLNSETSRIACFVFGIMFAAARINGVFVEIKKHRISMILSSVFLLVLACIDGFFHLKGGGHGDHGSHRHITAFAVPIVFLIYCNSPLCQFLSSRVSRKLGDLSFPLYLVQFPVLISFTSMAIIIATVHGRLNVVSIFAIGLSSVGVCLLCSFLFLPVEKFTRYVGTQLTRLTVSDESVAA